jgi:predicted Fe-S protein YdhL (DUF1289 family)
MRNDFWTYRPATETPSLSQAIEAGAVRADTTEAQWNQMTPGMKREVVRYARRKAAK